MFAKLTDYINFGVTDNCLVHSRASVVRGRVISGRGTGLRGVRVSHYRPADTGFTLTRTGGWFDLMVNGGGAVRLLFGKSPFSQVIATVWVPWNEVCAWGSLDCGPPNSYLHKGTHCIGLCFGNQGKNDHQNEK